MSRAAALLRTGFAGFSTKVQDEENCTARGDSRAGGRLAGYGQRLSWRSLYDIGCFGAGTVQERDNATPFTTNSGHVNRLVGAY
jgi:hypothetical protein